jgi:predicted GIY-YIG superfamily endonuclease
MEQENSEIINKNPIQYYCYILRSINPNYLNCTYNGSTNNLVRRLRQHNGEIVGGAKKTKKGRPWIPICHIKGFHEKTSALRFEWRIQHSKNPRPNCISNLNIILKNLIEKGDGVLPWPLLNIVWI